MASNTVVLDPLVVTSPLSSAAVMADAEPRISPVSVLAVPVPPLATATVPVTFGTFAFPNCPSSCQFVPSNVADIQCPASRSLAITEPPPPHFLIAAADAEFTASVAAPVFATSALNWM